MAWIVDSGRSFDTNHEGELVMVAASVEIVMLSVDSYRMLVEGDIIRNICFVGIVDFSEIDRSP